MATHNNIGMIGERIASNFLIKKDFEVIETNYRKKWGEIDIVAIKDQKIHFVEVKTVTRKSYNGVFSQEINNYRPEDNVHPFKLKRLSRAIQTYLLEKYKKTEPNWQFDLICVFLDPEKKVAKVKLIGDIVL